jgi:predicted nucleic acid-binding Zn ribbon protein
MALPPFHKLPAKGPPPLTAREQVLAQWRGMDYSPLEKARANVAKPLGQVLARVWEKRRFAQRVEESQIRQVWNQVLDPQITAHAQPVNLVRGTLFVTVDSSVWLAEIVQYRQREILERLRHSFGPEFIKRLSFRQG